MINDFLFTNIAIAQSRLPKTPSVGWWTFVLKNDFMALIFATVYAKKVLFDAAAFSHSCPRFAW